MTTKKIEMQASSFSPGGGRPDALDVIKNNVEALKTSFVYVNEKRRKIVVMDEGPCDKLICGFAEKAMPGAVFIWNEQKYRVYIVGHNLLQALKNLQQEH